MIQQKFFHFYPERILWVGAGLFMGSLLLAFPFLMKMGSHHSYVIVHEEKNLDRAEIVYALNLGLKDNLPVLPTPEIQKEMIFLQDSPRPGTLATEKPFLVQLKKSAESKRVNLPCRLDLERKCGLLRFAPKKSSLWVELTPLNEKIECKVFINMKANTIHSDQFFKDIQECPMRNAAEFAEKSAFRILAESLWRSKDLLADNPGERIEISSLEQLSLRKDEWLVFKDGKWEKGTIQEHLPIAHIEAVTPKGLVLEGWDDDEHVRILLSAATDPPFKMRGEDLFNSVRIRSEKQISCMLEKQCMILKLSDWVLKTDGKWKILRKKEQREAFLKGKLLGELFILDQILQKQGGQMIQGRLFNSGRTQMVTMEIAAQKNRKVKEAHK